jgi:fatty acid desaturase
MTRQIDEALTALDYSLVGPRGKEAMEAGLSQGEWYKCPIPRPLLKELMRRSDVPGLRDTALWIGAMAVTGATGALLWGSWAAVPLFVVYGVLYASGGEARWHECTHGTAFKTPWINDLVYQIACFCAMRDPTVSRWSHTRHHTDTYVIGRDPEIVGFRPPDILRHSVAFLGLREFPESCWLMLMHATGRLTVEEAQYVPETERAKVTVTARWWLLVYAFTVAGCIASGSLLPAMLVGLPRIYGVWFIQFVALPQHVGLLDDVLDHRLNTRTVRMNPLARFIYWNMNYHIEHHMFPMVPYHQLPRLHEAIRGDCPPAYPNIRAAYAEIVPTLLRQRSDPSYRVVRPIPGAREL